MKKQFKTIILLIVVSFLINLGIASIGHFSNDAKLIVGSLIYFFLSFYFPPQFKSLQNWIVYLIIIYPIFLFQLLFNIIDYESTINSLPIHFFFIFSSIVGYSFRLSKKFIIPIFLLLAMLCYFTFGKKMYMNYRIFGTATNRLNFRLPKVKMVDSKDHQFNFTENKITVLDFWNSKCGPCYREFPFIDSVYKVFSKSKYYIAVVNVPIFNEDYKQNFTLLNKFSYDFNKLFAIDENILDSFGITHFPTTIVIKNGAVIYKGEFKDIIKKLEP